MSERSQDGQQRAARPSSAPWRWLFAGLLLGALGVYAPSFSGGPISDDYTYLLNPWITQLRPSSLPELFDPRSQATLSLNNYAPLRPLLHGVQWKLFYDEAGITATNRAYHATNAVAHGVAAGLFALLLAQSGLPFAAAAAGSAVFLVHPANVEAVAWMCELWTSVALAFGLGALLAQRRRPLLAVVLFALALLAKPQAVCVLPVALLRRWAWRGRADAAPARWMLAWLAVLATVVALELATFVESASGAREPIHPDWPVRLRTLFALAGRYLAMALTGHGVAAFQQPPPATSWLDAWWLFGLAATASLSALAWRAARRGDEAAAYWVWGPAAFLPVSQLLPFLYPFCDRYLYFMLPGLIGGVLLAARDVARERVPRERRRAAAIAALAAAGALCLGFGAWSRARAAHWTSEDAVLADAARRWRDGVPAHLLRAREAARAGDLETALAELETCRARGWDYYTYVQKHPDFARFRREPRFDALLHAFAGDVIERAAKTRRHTQLDLRDIAEAHRRRGELPAAIARLEQAVALGGPIQSELRSKLVGLRAQADRSDGPALPVPTETP
jgi:hypothetical protein